MTETKPRRSMALWLYMAAFMLSAIGFFVKDYQNDTHGMIFSGFTGMLWYACAARERDTMTATRQRKESEQEVNA